jgi:A/G-specific adenine glycosylase
MLLVRTPPERVSQYFEAFFEELESVSALSRATPEEIATTIAPLGLAKRATYLSKLGDQLAERNGNVPESREELEELSGVGPYVAGAFQVLHRDKETWFADSNVVRILARFFGFERGHGTYRRKWFLEFAQKLFDHPFPPSEFGYAVLDFGREVCSNSPRCNICPVNEACSYYSESQGAQSTTS